MFIRSGMKASEVIAELQKLIDEHGDKECFSGGSDYPEGIVCVHYQKYEDAYIPAGSFVL